MIQDSPVEAISSEPDVLGPWTEPAFCSWPTSAEELVMNLLRLPVENPDRLYAFRGQASHEWTLQPSITRDIPEEEENELEEVTQTREKDLLERARNWGLGIAPEGACSDLHLLSLLQHHGCPTRLLDVTANPLTALWFAVAASRGHKDHAGVLLIVDITGTPWTRTSSRFTPMPSNNYRPLGREPYEFDGDYADALDLSRQASSLVRVFPASPDDRMKAQEGFFLLSSGAPRNPHYPIRGMYVQEHPREIGNLSKNRHPSRHRQQIKASTPVGLQAIIVSPDMKPSVEGVLEASFNRRERVLFPDMDGFVASNRRAP